MNPRCFLAGLAMTLSVGCATPTLRFTVTHAALINLAPGGNTVAVGEIQPNGHPEAAAQVSADLQSRIAHSLNPNIHLVASGGVVVISGTVVASTYEHHTETVSETCSTNAGGDVTNYDCSYTQEVGTGTVQVLFRVVEDTSAHRVVFEQTYARSRQVTNPSAADVQRLMIAVDADVVTDFAKVILPWEDKVTERLKDCDGDSRCKRAFELVKRGNLEAAEAIYTEVIGSFSDGKVPDGRLRQIGEAFYDRGVTRAHQDRYPEAIADMKLAIRLQPKREHWPHELAGFQAMAKDREALRAQGAR